MKQGSKKKIILGTILVSTIALAGVYTASARHMDDGSYGWDGGGQCSECDGNGYQQSRQREPLDEKSIEARDKFLAETSTQRKEIAIKRAERRAIMKNDNPDATRIALLTGELFDLREQLHTRAQESGIQAPGMRGHGYGSRDCNRSGGFQKRRQ